MAPLFPVFNISDVVGTSNRGDSFTQFQPRNVWSTLGSITWQHGKHSLKFGGDWRILNFNEGQNSSASGTFSFERQFTQGPNAVQASTTSGYGFASFLLGAASSGNVNAINPISTQGLYYAAYVQDDWKVSDRLTLNIGLRWDVGIGSREKYLPALKSGSLSLFPEYNGTLLSFLDPNADATSTDEVDSALADALPSNLEALDSAEAQDSDAIVVTKETADKYDLTTIGDLAKSAG